MSRHEDGFTLVEAAVAGFLVIVFFMAFASSVDIASDNARANRFSQQATALASAEVDYGRVLTWDELAMKDVGEFQPMLDEPQTSLLASEAGLEADETLVVDSGGALDAMTVHTTDGQPYTVWHYVTDAGNGLRRLVILVVWNVEGNEHTFQTSTLISQVTAGTGTTSTSPTTAATTTTTPPLGVLTVYKLKFKIKEKYGKVEIEVTVKDDNGDKFSGVVVTGTYSVDPTETGYPFSQEKTTDNGGKVDFTHNDTFADGTTIQFCVTDLEYPGYTFDGDTHCVSGIWDS